MARSTNTLYTPERFRILSKHGLENPEQVLSLTVYREDRPRLDVELRQDGAFMWATFSGRKTLRKLAWAILDATGGRKDP